MAEEDHERLSRTFWEVELRKMNDGLPRAKKRLSRLMEEESPSYTTLGGDVNQFNKGELAELARLLPGADVELPFVIIKKAGAKKGVYEVSGDAERETVNRILGRDPGIRAIYRADIYELTRRFPSLITFGFTL